MAITKRLFHLSSSACLHLFTFDDCKFDRELLKILENLCNITEKFRAKLMNSFHAEVCFLGTNLVSSIWWWFYALSDPSIFWNPESQKPKLKKWDIKKSLMPRSKQFETRISYSTPNTNFLNCIKKILYLFSFLFIWLLLSELADTMKK